MIGLGTNRLKPSRLAGLTSEWQHRNGQWIERSPYSAAATVALKAAFPAQWATIRDYGWEHPEIVGYMNAYAVEDAKIAYSLVPTLNVIRSIVWPSGVWAETGVPYAQNIETDVLACPNNFSTMQLIARKNGSYSTYQFSFFNGGYSAAPGGSYDRTGLGWSGGNWYNVKYNTDSNYIEVNGTRYGTTSTGSGSEPIVFGTRSGGTWYSGLFANSQIKNKNTGDLLRWYIPFKTRGGDIELLNLLDGTYATRHGSFTSISETPAS